MPLTIVIWFYLLFYPHCEMRVKLWGVERDNATEFGPAGAMMDFPRTAELEKQPLVTVARCYDEANERLNGR